MAQICGEVDAPHAFVVEFYNVEGWKEAKLSRVVPSNVVQSILQLAPKMQEEDRMVWVPSSVGDFMVASIWHLIRQKRNIAVSDKLLWNSMLPIKISFFGWKLLSRYIPIDEQLQHKILSFA